MSTLQSADIDAGIYRRHCNELMGYATALVGPDEAADVLSTVILRILERRRVGDLDEPRPYLYRAVLNQARSVLRRRSAHPWVELTEAGAGTNPGPEVDPDVIAAVAALPARQRAATYLVYWQGCTTAEAADLMGAAPGTVGRYLHLARRSMRRVLE